MSNPIRIAILGALFLAGAVGILPAMYLSLNFASRKAQVWIILVWLLVIMAVNAVAVGRFIARWRARRARGPDGPETDYHDPPA